MSNAAPTVATTDALKPGLVSLLRVLATPRMLLVTLMGFASGLPLMLSGSVLIYWVRASGIDLATIAYFAAIRLPYSLKFVWAPLLDRFTPPLGRRRGFIFITQLAVIASLLALAASDPARHLNWVIAAATLLAFNSASQDIVIDAYRREYLPESELGTGTGLFVFGYRLGMLLASGGGLIVAGLYSFNLVFLLMAGVMALMLLVTLAAPEPNRQLPPATLFDAVVAPLADILQRNGISVILSFIVLYKIGDAVASSMTSALYHDLGYTAAQVGAIVKGFGTVATIVGGIVGGLLMQRIGYFRALLGYGVLQILSTASFGWLALQTPSTFALASVIGFETLSIGLGTSAYVAFLGVQTNVRFTAFQYALFSALATIPALLINIASGFLVKHGYIAQFPPWPVFFLGCALLGIPGLLLLPWLRPHLPKDDDRAPTD